MQRSWRKGDSTPTLQNSERPVVLWDSHFFDSAVLLCWPVACSAALRLTKAQSTLSFLREETRANTKWHPIFGFKERKETGKKTTSVWHGKAKMANCQTVAELDDDWLLLSKSSWKTSLKQWQITATSCLIHSYWFPVFITEMMASKTNMLKAGQM